ncbi:ImmA/IrrE family metallo-endopeptidase [Glycomyces buryatensis]|uniref:ImmA/IrrE family metallo-endopeptidase n=1 Tax=Glycomyces buryatensis TaxID=2570927 RepID=A0A4V4HSB7_9ACTN|nr:ImmA/IrrE family metallo-endopeptidase [Glycomyces buryatensis]THV41166.1 ImmA/IrrE family metallo-endopeptidase [Glycomyces buryatensis]
MRMPTIHNAAQAQAGAMLNHLDQVAPGAAARLADDPFTELASWEGIRVKRVPELEGTTAGSCSVSGAYSTRTAPPALVVAESLSPRRQRFTLLHELGHHLQQNDLTLGEAALEHDDSKTFEDAACDAFAAAVLLPEPLASAVIEEHGATVETALELYSRTSASRAAICVRLAAAMQRPGVAAVIEESGTVSFAAAHGRIYPPARGSDQRANPLVKASLTNTSSAAVIRHGNALIRYSTGQDSAPLYGQAAWCDGLLLAVMYEFDAPWLPFSPPRERQSHDVDESTECGVCTACFTAADWCGQCREPRCPEGHCGCTRDAERICPGCFLLRHPAQFATGFGLCVDCCS